MTKAQQSALAKWAEIATEYRAIEEFLDWAGYSGKAEIIFSVSRTDLLDQFYGINRKELDDARRTLLDETRTGLNRTGDQPLEDRDPESHP